LRREPPAELDEEQPERGRFTEPGETGKSANSEPSYVLTELIITLLRKRVITDAEGKALLQKLLL
jgi:hypothetical protein